MYIPITGLLLDMFVWPHQPGEEEGTHGNVVAQVVGGTTSRRVRSVGAKEHSLQSIWDIFWDIFWAFV